MKRRSITPAHGTPLPPGVQAGLPPTRRVDGPRREASDRVTFWVGETEATGWALNVSRSGLRAIVEDVVVDLGAVYDIAVGEGPRRPGKIVWVQEEPDGLIVGIAFDLNESERPPSLVDPQEAKAGLGGGESGGT